MCKHFGSVPKAVKVTIERIFLLLWVKYISFFKSKKKSETNEKIEEMSKEWKWSSFRTLLSNTMYVQNRNIPPSDWLESFDTSARQWFRCKISEYPFSWNRKILFFLHKTMEKSYFKISNFTIFSHEITKMLRF